MELLAFTDFKNKQSTMPWIRMSLATCQMCSPKAYIKDGVSRFITPSDFTKLKQKAMLDKVKQAEELLGKGYELLQASPLTLDQQAHPMARYLTRLGLFLLNKESKGQEGKEYTSLANITDAFTAECFEMKQHGHLNARQAELAEESDDKEMPEALESCQDPIQIACKMFKLKVGSHYTHNGQVMKLTKVEKDSATLVYNPFFGSAVDHTLTHDDLKGIKPFTRPVPHLHSAADIAALYPSNAMVKEIARAKAQHLLYEKYLQCLGCHSVSCCPTFFLGGALVAHPAHYCRTGEFDVVVSSMGHLFANADFKKGELTLLPFGNVAVVAKEKVAKTSVVLFLAGWRQEDQLVVSHTKCNFEKATGCWSPFFWCKESKDDKEEKPNMTKATVKYDELTMPCIKNKEKLTKGTALFLEPTEESKKARKK